VSEWILNAQGQTLEEWSVQLSFVSANYCTYIHVYVCTCVDLLCLPCHSNATFKILIEGWRGRNRFL